MMLIFRCVVSLAFVLTLLAGHSRSAIAQDDQTQRIAFQDVEQAFANGVANERVTVIVFGAEWCGVCKKVERTVFADPDVRDAAKPFSWAKVDIDQEKQLSAMLGVRAVPTFMFLNTKGEVLHEHVGNVSASRMSEMLGTYADQADEPGAARGRWNELFELTEKAGALPEGEDVPTETVREIVKLLAEPDPIGVEQTRHRLVAMGPAVWNGLIDTMGSKKLAVRAAAYDLLKETTGKTLAFDPFLKPAERRTQIESWRAWHKLNRPKPKPDPKSDDDAAADKPNKPDKPRGDKPAKPKPNKPATVPSASAPTAPTASDRPVDGDQ